MLDEYGDDLAVIFVESQGADARRAESFAYERGWMGRGAFWTRERPASTGLGYLPSFILLDAEGTVLMKGNTASMKSKIADAVEDQIKQAAQLPEGLDKDFKKAWKALREGDWATAAERIDKQAAEGGELAVQAEVLRARLTAALEGTVAGIEKQIEIGYLVEARAEAERLHSATKGLDEWHTRAASLLEGLDSDGMADEIKAAEAFSKLYAKVCADGIEDNVRKLEKFAAKYPDTLAASRAKHLLSIGE
ncbi:MAG: hypothetical protein AAFZ65_06055 [Planctomycetota bacterium]